MALRQGLAKTIKPQSKFVTTCSPKPKLELRLEGYGVL